MNATQDRPSRARIPVVLPGGPVEAAARMFDLVGLSPDDPQVVPVDLDAIATALGLKVYMAAFEDPNISGMLILDPARVPVGTEAGARGTVFLKRGEFPLRSRFTLAHEIGHVVLGHRDGGVITDFFRGRTDGHVNPQERDANEFAAELLMPRKLFKQIWGSSSEEELSIVFGVSVTAAAVRAKALGLSSRYEY